MNISLHKKKIINHNKINLIKNILYDYIAQNFFFLTFLNYRVKMPTADFIYQRPIPVDILYKPYLKT